MPDVDPQLEDRLRSFLDEIKAQRLPQALAGFRPATVRSGRKVLNLFAGATAVAVIAAGVAVFAVELNGHQDAGSPARGGNSAATPTPEPTPPILPSFPAFNQASSDSVLIPKTYGAGTATLPTVTLGPNEGIGINYGCISSHPTVVNSIAIVGKGVPAVLGTHDHVWLSDCSNPKGASAEYRTAGGAGGPITLRFNADPSVRWVILVYEFPSIAAVIPTPTASGTATSFPGPTPPFLAQGPAPAGATVLIPVTYGMGSMTLPTFTEAPNQILWLEVGCVSTKAAVTTVTINSYDPSFSGNTVVGQCYGGSGGSGGGGGSGVGGRVTLKVQADPSERWVILVFEAPPGFLGL